MRWGRRSANRHQTRSKRWSFQGAAGGTEHFDPAVITSAGWSRPSERRRSSDRSPETPYLRPRSRRPGCS